MGRRIRLLLRLAAVPPIVVGLVTQRGSLAAAAARIGRLSPWWFMMAIALETVSFVAAAELQHHLLVRCGFRVDRRSLVAVSYAATAIGGVLPAGPAVAGGYTYRALIRRGSTAGAAAWILLAAGVLSTVTLALLGLAGAQLRGFGILCSAVGGIAGTGVLLAGAAAVGALVWSSRHRVKLEQLALSLWARCRRRARIVAARPRGSSDDHAAALDPVGLVVALGLAGANWVADIAALGIAFVALGVAVPWHGLLLAYALTQLATSIPIVPGSIGVAEGSMAAALVCSGVRPTAAIAGVVVYRLVSFWLVLPAGWLAWAALRRGEASGEASGRNQPAYSLGDG